MSGMCLEYLTTLNQLVEEGDEKAVKHYITENGITAKGYYEYFKSNSEYKRLGPVGRAAMCDNVKVMKTLLDMGFSANERQHFSRSLRPIHIACESGSLAAVKMLVEDYGVDLTSWNNNYRRPVICRAADNGQIKVLEYLLENGISLDGTYGREGISALHAAAEKDQVEVCKFLLSKGADVNLGGDDEENTPLIYAVQNGSMNAARVLLDAGAEIDFANMRDETAFFKATVEDDLEMMKLLHSKGADPEYEDKNFISPLHIAVGFNRHDTAFYLVNELNVTMYHPVDYEIWWKGESACTIALEEGHYDMVKLLINAGYDPSEELGEYEKKDIDNLLEYPSSSKKIRQFMRIENVNVVKLQELKQMIARPRSLIALCALKVRAVLGRRLPVDLDCLPLPEPLKKAIVLCGVEKLS